MHSDATDGLKAAHLRLVDRKTRAIG